MNRRGWDGSRPAPYRGPLPPFQKPCYSFGMDILTHLPPTARLSGAVGDSGALDHPLGTFTVPQWPSWADDP